MKKYTPTPTRKGNRKHWPVHTPSKAVSVDGFLDFDQHPYPATGHTVHAGSSPLKAAMPTPFFPKQEELHQKGTPGNPETDAPVQMATRREKRKRDNDRGKHGRNSSTANFHVDDLV